MKTSRHSGPGQRSHLFTVRVWKEEISDGLVEWRGKIQLLTNKDTRYFRNWTTLTSLLTAMLSGVESSQEDGE